MGLETGVNYIADLVSTNPTIGDDVSVGDDHIRNVKRALQASIPKMGGIMNDLTVSSGSSITIDTAKNHQLYVTSYNGTIAVTIPAAATVGKGFTFTLIEHGPTATAETNTTLSGADTFVDGNTTYKVRRGTTAMFVSDGVSKWAVVCGDTDFWKNYYRNLADSALQTGLSSIWLPLKAATVPGSGFPALGQTTGSNGIVLDHYAFDAAAIESLQWDVVLPVSYLQQGALAGKIHAELFWFSTSGTGAAVWGASAAIPAFNTAWDIAFGTELTQGTDAVAANYLQRTRINNIVPNTTAIYSNTGKQMLLRLRRMATDGSDTLAVDALLTAVRLYFATDATNESAYS